MRIKSKTVMKWSSQKKKDFFVTFILPQGKFCSIRILSQCIVYWIYSHLWDISFSVSETSLKALICKSLRLLLENWLKTSPQRRLWDLSDFLRDIFELHRRLQFLAFKLKYCSSEARLPKLNLYRKLFRAWFVLEVYLGYLYEKDIFRPNELSVFDIQ